MGASDGRQPLNENASEVGLVPRLRSLRVTEVSRACSTSSLCSSHVPLLPPPNSAPRQIPKFLLIMSEGGDWPLGLSLQERGVNEEGLRHHIDKLGFALDAFATVLVRLTKISSVVDSIPTPFLGCTTGALFFVNP